MPAVPGPCCGACARTRLAACASSHPDVPQWLADVITRLHAKDPAGRFPSALALADVLRNGLTQLQRQDQLICKPGRPVWRRRLLVAACVLLLGAALGLGIYFGGDPSTPETPAPAPQAVSVAKSTPAPPSPPLAKDAPSPKEPIAAGKGTLRKAIDLATAGRAKEAAALYVQHESAIPLSKASYVQLTELVDAFNKARQLPEAREACLATLSKFPNRHRVRLLLGYIQFAAGDAEAADTLLTTGRLDESLSSLVGYGLGRLYIDAGQLDKAIAVWTQVVRDNPSDPDAHVRLGDSYRYQARVSRKPQSLTRRS